MLETGLKTSVSAVYFNSLVALSNSGFLEKNKHNTQADAAFQVPTTICETYSTYVTYDVFTVFEIPEAKSVTPMVQKLGHQKNQFIIKLKTRSMTRQCSSVWENPFQQSNVNVALV